MKRHLLILCILLGLVGTRTYAYDYFYVDGIQYTITSETNLTAGVSDNGVQGYSGSIIIPNSVEYKGKRYSVTSIEREAFYIYSQNLTSITIPNSVITIGESAFNGCN